MTNIYQISKKMDILITNLFKLIQNTPFGYEYSIMFSFMLSTDKKYLFKYVVLPLNYTFFYLSEITK